jgi:hypothetical protein
MPDTMIQTDMPAAPASCGVMDRYRSPQIGKLVAARAKASAKIKAIIKDKRAEIPSKTGGRGYQYAYADLADVLEAVEDAISEVALAIIQTTQDRGRDGTFLITTLAHESDQWVAAEIRLKSADAGPQVYGSEMTYLRRYAVLAALALAPEADDDGKAAQDRADQQGRQRPAQRADRPMPPVPAPRASQPVQQAPSEVSEPAHMEIPIGAAGTLYGRWTRQALDTLAGRPERWRRDWLALHVMELAEMRGAHPEYCDRVEAAAITPDPAQDAA